MFFFSSRRRHTRLQGDWSSDVCSSDLGDHSTGWGRPLEPGQLPTILGIVGFTEWSSTSAGTQFVATRPSRPAGSVRAVVSLLRHITGKAVLSALRLTPATAPLWLSAVTLVRTPPTRACRAWTVVGAVAFQTTPVGSELLFMHHPTRRPTLVMAPATQLRPSTKCARSTALPGARATNPEADPLASAQAPTTYPELLTSRPAHCGPEAVPISCMGPA